MTETSHLLNAAWPFVALLALYAVFHRLGNMTVTLSFASKTATPEPSKGQMMVLRDELEAKRHERDEARRIAEEMRRGGT